MGNTPGKWIGGIYSQVINITVLQSFFKRIRSKSSNTDTPEYKQFKSIATKELLVVSDRTLAPLRTLVCIHSVIQTRHLRVLKLPQNGMPSGYCNLSRDDIVGQWNRTLTAAAMPSRASPIPTEPEAKSGLAPRRTDRADGDQGERQANYAIAARPDSAA